jgi:hypothetical protein
MKSKFLSVALIVAVSLGMLLVPAVSMVSADSGDAGITAVSDKAKVVFTDTFVVNVTIDNPNALPLNAMQVFMIFDNSMVTVNSISSAGTPFTQTVSAAAYDNTTGLIGFSAGTSPGTNTTAASCFVMTIDMESKSTPGDTTIAFQKLSPTRETKVFGDGLGNVLNWSDVTNCTVTVGVPVLTVNITPWVTLPGPVTYATGGIAVVYNGTWIVDCVVPDMGSPYTQMVVPYNMTFLLPASTNGFLFGGYPFAWDECIVVVALDMVPGWGWTSWVGAAGVDLGGMDSPTTPGLWITLRSIKLDALQKNLTAVFGMKAPALNVTPDSLSFMCNEGTNATPKTLLMVNTGGGTLNWNATSDESWLSVSPTSGAMTTNFGIGMQVLNVSTDSTGLGVNTYTGNISIVGSPNATIPVTLLVNPATAIDVCRTISGTSNSGLPGETDETYAGETFNVTVSFTAPVDDFNAIGMTDTAPDGWTVEVDKTWCSPEAYTALDTGNKAEYLWDSIPKDTVVTARYQVTVPTTADPGLNTFSDCDLGKGWVEYYFGIEGPHVSCIACDTDVIVTVPGDVVGKTFDVNHNDLPDTDVRLNLEGVGYMRNDISTPLYVNTAYILGIYSQVGNKTLYFELDADGSTLVHLTPVYHALTTQALLSAGEVFNFSGNYGLIPCACSMNYAQKSVNLWIMDHLYPVEWQLEEWKVNQVIASWQVPS